MGFRIIDTEATGKGRDIQESVSNICHIVDSVTDKRDLLLVSSSLRSKSAGVVLAVLLGIPAMELLYTAIDSGLRMLLNQPTFTIAPYMPDVLLREGKPDTLRAILSSAVTIGIFLSLSISVFDKRDVN